MRVDDCLELERYRADMRAGLLLRLPVPLDATVWRVRENPACHFGVQNAEIFLFGKVGTHLQTDLHRVGLVGGTNWRGDS